MHKFWHDLINKYKLKDTSTKYTIDVLKKVYKVAKENGEYKGYNPFQDWKKPKIQDNRRIRYLTEDEAELLLGELYKRHYDTYCITLFALHTGARRKEVYNVKWNDVDLNNEVIKLERKGGKIGHVYMSEKLLCMLKDRKLKAKSEYVFPGNNGNCRVIAPLTVFLKVTKELFNKNVPVKDRVTFHTLRHTFASWLVMNNTPLYHVAQLMGHSTTKMTERYAHLSPENERHAIRNTFNASQHRKMNNNVIEYTY